MNHTPEAPGNIVQRKAWILLALISTLMMVFGLQMYFSTPDLNQPIVGSLCCNGRKLSTATPWTIDYMLELAKYMGTFTVLDGVFAMALVLVPFRRRQRWAWWVLWAVPALFLVHGAVLGSFPFDLVPLGISLLGLLVPVRLFFPAKQAAPQPAFVP